MRKWSCYWALMGALGACGGTANGGSEGASSEGASGAGGDSTQGAGNAGMGGNSESGAGASGAAGMNGSGGGGLLPELSTAVTKIDLLFMVDNSISMTDKQEVLSLAVPELVSRLINPVCVDATGNEYEPPAPGEECPEGQSREFTPISDINIGVVSSSLGDAGADVVCPQEGAQDYRADRADMAHLIGSLDRSQVQGDTAEGFLAWRPGSTSVADFNRDIQQMVRDVRQFGCGWEASLESWYRFLVDPFPYQRLSRVQCPGSTSKGLNCVQPATDGEGRVLLDEVLLAQRAAFSRPDSLLAIVMLSDENDCSFQIGGQTWIVAAVNDARPMFRGSSTCESNANDKCCYSCPLGPPPGCSQDPICDADPDNGVLENRLPDNQDRPGLRCYQQKRRFGMDFLYPTQRYVSALSQLELCWSAPDLSLEGCPSENIVQNPLYEVWDRRKRVFLTGIVGVPWQAIASANDSRGRPLSDPSRQLRFKSAAEMDARGDDTWAQILGSPGVAWRAAANGRAEVAGLSAVPPGLPQMVESEFPRSGVTDGNPLNGREFDTTQGIVARGAPDDLQYACIFPLAEPRDCTMLDLVAGDDCDCFEGNLDRPLCEQTPGTSPPGTTQYFAKAYPGSRQLAVLKDYGENSIVTSICARNVTASDDPDFGYRPVARAIIERLSEAINAP